MAEPASGLTLDTEPDQSTNKKALTETVRAFIWWVVQDSNLRPIG